MVIQEIFEWCLGNILLVSSRYFIGPGNILLVSLGFFMGVLEIFDGCIGDILLV